MTIPRMLEKPYSKDNQDNAPVVVVYETITTGTANKAVFGPKRSRGVACSFLLCFIVFCVLIYSIATLYSSVNQLIAIEQKKTTNDDDNLNFAFENVRHGKQEGQKLEKNSARFKLSALTKTVSQCTVAETDRFDCWPEYVGATEDKCKARNCCWKPVHSSAAPFCFFPANYSGYTASDVKTSSHGVSAMLTRTSRTIFPPDINTLKLQIDFQTKSRLRIKIFDPAEKRFEPPVNVPTGSASVSNPMYKVNITEKPFGIKVTRASTGAVVFDTNDVAPFIFADQYLQIGTKLSSPYLYGLGEHRNDFHQDPRKWDKIVFWTNGGGPRIEKNGYGSHPFYMNLEPTSGNGVANAHGVFLLNSNAGDIALQPYSGSQGGALTFRFIGGILDFFVLLGPEPVTVSAQYTDVVGRPYFPPFWSLGFHLCRWGYMSSARIQAIIKRNRAARIPYDIQWADIDYMGRNKDFTYNTSTFESLPDIIKDLHDNDQRFIVITDPGISSTQPAGSYAPFDDGKSMDVFVKNDDGSILINKVWPGETAFPDFFHPAAYAYWSKQVKEFHTKVNFDGLWLDMNEPAGFMDGSSKGCTKNKYDLPPYIPGTIDGGKLIVGTLCPSAKHYLSRHYDLHNMYGWSEANISRGALDSLYGNKRSPIISRSTFVSSGTFTGHWLGDNGSTYKDMYYSIPGVLNFNLFGIPLVGPDICGFGGTTTPELCTRWQQLGVFFPFMRNHNTAGAPDQDPGSFKAPYVDYIRSALQTRYRLLAVLYTGFYKAHTEGLPIVRPLFYIFPGTETISSQFMWMDQILVSPVLTQGATTVQAFIPKCRWYDLYTGKAVEGTGTNVTLQAPLSTINAHIKEGTVLPLLPPTERTNLSRKEKFILVVATCPMGRARGDLFWDDGESADSVSAKRFSFISFNLTNSNQFTIKAEQSGYAPTGGIKAGMITVLGVPRSPSKASVNGQSVSFTYNKNTQVLQLIKLDIDMLKGAEATWS